MSFMPLALLSDESSQTGMAWMLCILGGIFMGSYPVFIKVPRVIAAKVNPIVFQCYKSFWVFALAWIFLLVNYLRGKDLFTFTYWGVIAAACWVPAGFAYIAAVSMCGVATACVLNQGVNTIVQFIVGIMTEQVMKKHGGVVIAPYYLVALMLGMVGLVFSPTIDPACFQKASSKVSGKDIEQAATASTISFDDESPGQGQGTDALLKPEDSQNKRREFVTGAALAALAGLFSGLKFAVGTVGKAVEKSRPGASEEHAVELFNTFESYLMSFGIGCALATTLFFGIFALLQKGVRKQPMPAAEFPVMKIYGFLAGSIWLCAFMCQQGANNVGGSGSFGPATNACTLIVAGLWGLLYYREVTGLVRVSCWVTSAAWTIAFVILLSNELEKAA